MRSIGVSPAEPVPRILGVLETALYVDDLARAAGFYRNLFGFAALVETPRLVALDVAGRDVLLLFKREATVEPFITDGGVIPPHDSDGPSHFAFGIAADDLAEWEARLASAGVQIESRVGWPRGGSSLYFRDPDNHSVELVTPGCWEIW